MRAESDTASISCFLTLRVVSEQTWIRRVGPSSSGGREESFCIWRGVFGVTTESSNVVLRHIPGMRELTNNSGKLENHVLLGRGGGVNLSPSLLQDRRGRRDTGGEMWPLRPLGEAQRLFPKQRRVTRAAGACFMWSRSRVQTGQLIAVVISGGSRGL